MQAQSLYQPFEIPLKGADPLKKYVATSVDFVRSHLDFLATDRVQKNPPFKRTTAGYSIQGVKLPKTVLEKILYRNAARLLA